MKRLVALILLLLLLFTYKSASAKNNLEDADPIALALESNEYFNGNYYFYTLQYDFEAEEINVHGFWKDTNIPDLEIGTFTFEQMKNGINIEELIKIWNNLSPKINLVFEFNQDLFEEHYYKYHAVIFNNKDYDMTTFKIPHDEFDDNNKTERIYKKDYTLYSTCIPRHLFPNISFASLMLGTDRIIDIFINK